MEWFRQCERSNDHIGRAPDTMAAGSRRRCIFILCPRHGTLEPTLVGWISVLIRKTMTILNRSESWALAWKPELALRLYSWAEASLRLLVETGVDRIANHLEQLTDYLCVGLQGRDINVSSATRLKSLKSSVFATGLAKLNGPYSSQSEFITAPRGDRLVLRPLVQYLKH